MLSNWRYTMSPRKLTLDKDRVLAASLQLVRRDGLAALSARAVADQLGASVAPIYRAYASMDELSKAVLDAALQQLDEYVARPYTDFPFRSAGVGLVMFARDEPRLFRALFIDQPNAGETVTRMRSCLRKIGDEEPAFHRLRPALRDELIMDLWIYTHGLASMVIANLLPRPEPDLVDRKLKRVGAIVIGAAMTSALEPGPMLSATAKCKARRKT
jgi:AcrR family transcriptional regulator